MIECPEAVLSIEGYVECPGCGHDFDMLSSDFDFNDEGAIIKQAVPSGDWHDPHNNFEEDINCPSCNHNFIVKGIAW